MTNDKPIFVHDKDADNYLAQQQIEQGIIIDADALAKI